MNNFKNVQSFVHSGWKRRGQKLLDSLEKALPDKVLLSSKLLLTSESHLKSLRSAIANVVAGKFLALASEALVALKKFTDGGGELPPELKQMQKALMKARQSGKIAISVDWAIGQIQGFQPTSGEDMVTHARNVLVKCKSKGVSRDDEHARVLAVIAGWHGEEGLGFASSTCAVGRSSRRDLRR